MSPLWKIGSPSPLNHVAVISDPTIEKSPSVVKRPRSRPKPKSLAAPEVIQSSVVSHDETGDARNAVLEVAGGEEKRSKTLTVTSLPSKSTSVNEYSTTEAPVISAEAVVATWSVMTEVMMRGDRFMSDVPLLLLPRGGPVRS